MRSVELLAACERGDMVRVEQLGWRPVLDALRAWRKRLDGDELAPYASLLGEEDPAAIVAVVLGLAASSEYRPAAADIYQRLHPPARRQVPQGRQPQVRPDQTPEAYAAVLAAVQDGASVCECFPRPTTVEIDAAGVLRCPDGLEPGQADAAVEAVG